MNFDRFAGLFAVSAICLTLGFAAWTGIVGPIWQAGHTATPEQWLGFLGSVVGALVTLIAAAIAWIAVRQQIFSQRQLELDRRSHEAEKDRRREDAAKRIGVIALSQTVVTAGMMHRAAEKAFNATTAEDAARWQNALNQAAAQVEDGLSQFTLRQIVAELNELDREQFLMLLVHIGTIVSIHNRPPGVVDERQRLKATRDHLNALPKYLARIDSKLLNLFKA